MRCLGLKLALLHEVRRILRRLLLKSLFFRKNFEVVHSP